MLLPVFPLDPPNPPTEGKIEDADVPILTWTTPESKVDGSPITGYKVVEIPHPTTYGSDLVDVADGGFLNNSACVEVNCSMEERILHGKGNTRLALSKLLPGVRYNLTVMSLSYGQRLQSVPSKAVAYLTAKGGQLISIVLLIRNKQILIVNISSEIRC